jgi:transcriptional regulator with XRE-family HTH domain
MKETGDRLRQVRKSLGRTQQEMADMLGISKQTLLRYEKGQRDPEISFLYRFIDSTDANCAFVFMGQEPIFTTGDHNIISLDGNERILIELFRELKDSDKQRLLNTLEILIDEDHIDRTDKLRTLKRPLSSNQ